MTFGDLDVTFKFSRIDDTDSVLVIVTIKSDTTTMVYDNTSSVDISWNAEKVAISKAINNSVSKFKVEASLNKLGL